MAPLRPPEQVMRLERLGSFFQTPISFMRTLIRRMSSEAWRFETSRFELDDQGFGRAVYSIGTPHGEFSFIVFSHDLDPQLRTDRVIAERWDATFVLREGTVDDAHLERLERNVPLQEAGRCSCGELVLSRANKSVRLFDYIADRLATGQQPDADRLAAIGYLMRTTAVYGNGKFGLCDFPKLQGQHVLNAPFQAEMLTVFMVRHFSIALVEHVARQRNPHKAVALTPDRRRILGIGNATGLGMAPFLIKHPLLIHAWILARETALARVRGRPSATPGERLRFCHLLDRAIAHVGEWTVEDARQQARIHVLRLELDALRSRLESDPDGTLPESDPWDGVFRHVETTGSLETQELMVSLLLETFAPEICDLERSMATRDIERTVPAMRLGTLKEILETHYRWALEIDFSNPQAQRYFWYYSEEKEEPRRGLRFEEPGADCEMRLGFGRDVGRLHAELGALPLQDLAATTAEYLFRRPRWRSVIRRVQSLHERPYGEIRDNLLGAGCLPIDLLRCKLSFFGATKWDPKSDLWTRITLYQGAPHVEDLGAPDVDDWAFPVVPQSTRAGES